MVCKRTTIRLLKKKDHPTFQLDNMHETILTICVCVYCCMRVPTHLFYCCCCCVRMKSKVNENILSCCIDVVDVIASIYYSWWTTTYHSTIQYIAHHYYENYSATETTKPKKVYTHISIRQTDKQNIKCSLLSTEYNRMKLFRVDEFK